MNNSERFTEQLRRQLNFIRTSCELFDRGMFEEGMRISVNLRILFHDTKRSTSLLSHLNAKHIKMLSTVGQIEGCQYADPMVGFSNCGEQQGLRPSCLLYAFWSECRELSIEEWWNQIIRVQGGNRLSRRSMALTLANQDGGAHVDSKVDANYQDFNKYPTITHKMSDGTELPGFNETSLIVMRQIGFEVLNSPDLMNIAGLPMANR